MSAQILKRFCVFVMSRRCFFGVFFYSLNLFFFPSSSCCSSSFGVLESTAFSVRGRPRGKYAGRNEGNCCMCVCLMLFPRRVPGFAMEPLCVVEAIFHFYMFSVTFFSYSACVCVFVCFVCLFVCFFAKKGWAKCFCTVRRWHGIAWHGAAWVSFATGPKSRGEREREVKFFCGISGPLLGLGQDWSWIFRSDMQAAKGMGEES